VPSLNNSRLYRKFIKDRDLALEQILNNTLVKIDNDLRNLFSAWIHLCLSSLDRSKILKSDLDDLKMLANLNSTMELASHHTTASIKTRIKQMRRKVYILTAAGEAQAIAMATNRLTHVTADQDKLRQVMDAPDYKGTNWTVRIRYHLISVLHKLKQTTHWLMINPDVSREEAVKMLLKKLPRRTILQKMKPALKPIKMHEADDTPMKKPNLQADYFSDEDWNSIIEDVTSNFPVNRGPENIWDLADSEGDHYAWQLEQEMTQDFVKQVRDGQIAAANQNGLTDFVWISIVDGVTCEDCCGNYGCVDFDGLLTSEVEKLTKGETVVPPAHFNCRCAIAPVTDDMPTVDSNETEFDEWLNS
jgi:hypothetical protein